MQNLPIQKQVVINLGDDSSDEEDQMSHTVPSDVNKLLGGLDDFLKEARRSAESTTNLQKIDSLSLAQQEVNRSSTENQLTPVNQSNSYQTEVKQSNQTPENQIAISLPATNQSPSAQTEVKQSNQILMNHSVVSQPAISQQTVKQPLLSQPAISEPAIKHLHSEQQAINQAASEKWKKWKRERELKEMFSKCEGEVLQQRYSL